MTDNEIIKALECCKGQLFCISCDFLSLCGGKRTIVDSALDLINRQKAEIERLKDKLDTVKQKVIETIPLVEDDIKTAKSEAYKEFAERLKDMHKHNTTSVVSLVTVFDNINNLVKEMVGDNDE